MHMIGSMLCQHRDCTEQIKQAHSCRPARRKCIRPSKRRSKLSPISSGTRRQICHQECTKRGVQTIRSLSRWRIVNSSASDSNRVPVKSTENACYAKVFLRSKKTTRREQVGQFTYDCINQSKNVNGARGLREGWSHYGLESATFIDPHGLLACFETLEMIVRINELIQTRHGCHGAHCVLSTLSSRPGGDVAKKTCNFKSCPGASTRSRSRLAPRCRNHGLRRNVSRSLQSCAKNSKLHKMLGNETQQSKVFGPYFALRALLSYLAAHCDESRSLVDCKKRPKFRLSLPCRPATDSAALLFHRAAFTTKCDDTALARASSLPASCLTAWGLWTGFFLSLLRVKCPY